jgi:hypothetical protein
MPTASELRDSTEVIAQALDFFAGEKSIYALSDTPLPNAVCLKQWLLNRAGWIDEDALPQPAQPSIATSKQTLPSKTSEVVPSAKRTG